MTRAMPKQSCSSNGDALLSGLMRFVPQKSAPPLLSAAMILMHPTVLAHAPISKSASRKALGFCYALCAFETPIQ